MTDGVKFLRGNPRISPTGKDNNMLKSQYKAAQTMSTGD